MSVLPNVKHIDCEKCGREIGTENYVIAEDGITHRMVTFHKRCQPAMSDVRQHYGVTLAPIRLGYTPKDFT